MSITAIIAPADVIATKPKLSFSEALLSFFKAEVPMASPRIKGTVNAPVVAPDASKDIAKNSRDVNKAKIKIIKYNMVNILYKGMLYTILIKPSESKIEMPIDTTTTMLVLDIRPEVTKSTCPARICKSGSAIEIKNPRTTPTIANIHILLVLVRFDPIRFPMGVIPISTPNKNIDKPITIKNAPRINLNMRGVSSGVITKFSIKTIIVIGSTEDKTSLNFSTNTFKYKSLPFC